MALTDRFEVNGNLITITNCDGSKETFEIDCGCSPETENPGTTPPPLAQSLCEAANWYAWTIGFILNNVQENLSSQSANFVGRHLAIAAAASNLQLPYSPWAFFMNGYIGAENPTAADNRTNLMSLDWYDQNTNDILVCIIHDILQQQGGVFTYDKFVTGMTAQGWYASGAVIAAIPLGVFLEKVYKMSSDIGGFYQRLSGLTSTNCDDCTTGTEPVVCDDNCIETTCYRLIPDPMTLNAFPVTGFSEIIDFSAPNDAVWWGENFSPLRIDLGEFRCIKEIDVISYTPCGNDNGSGNRSARYRVELDDSAVTEFKCSALNRAQYLPCGDYGGFDGAGVIRFVFPDPLAGRHIQIVPLREHMTIVQVNVILCNQ